MDFTIEIVSRNLATTSNFVELRDNVNCTFFECRVSDATWHPQEVTHGKSHMMHLNCGSQLAT